MSETVVIADTSVLINFLVLDGVGLLARLPHYRFVVTEHVRAKVTDDFPDQLQRLEAAFTAGILEEIRVTDLGEVQLFAQLTATRLGIGECSAIAVAARRRFARAIDDKRAVKKLARGRSWPVPVLTCGFFPPKPLSFCLSSTPYSRLSRRMP